MSASRSASSQRQLLSQNNINGDQSGYGAVFRDPSTISTNDIGFKKVLQKDEEVGEQTLYQVDIENDTLLRKSHRSELANKNKCLTRRWQTTLVTSLIVLTLAGGIGGLAYWITLPKVITQPFLLYGASCYMNSRSCDATRMLWCPAGTCICTGNYQWNTTAQNCSCGAYQLWNGLTCQNYSSYGDPCNTIPCLPTLTCKTVINQTYTTGQSICDCDNTTYLQTSGASQGTCVAKITYGVTCKTETDCMSWLGLTCQGVPGSLTCACSSTAYWNGTICVQNALGWQPCSTTAPVIPCDTTRGLTCTAGTCQCDSLSYYDNVTTLYCQTKKTYAVACNFGFQCNTTVNLTCPTVSTGCNCYSTSYAYMCDCQLGTFWDGQRCTATHIFNGTCPGQYACSANLVCYLGHCICPGNMVWNIPTPNTCACTTGTAWNTTSNSCV